MAKQMRKAINFDLDTKKLKDAYCVTNRPLEYLKAYGEIKDFMKSKGFLHRQWSGYVSKEPLSKAQVDYLVQNNSHRRFRILCKRLWNRDDCFYD